MRISLRLAPLAALLPAAASAATLIHAGRLIDGIGNAPRERITIMFGTDTGVGPHGSNGKEFGYMVEAGMPVMDAIRSATMVPAKYLGIDDRLGSLEAGKIADIVGVPGDPTADVHTLEHVSFVMKEGVIYKR